MSTKTKSILIAGAAMTGAGVLLNRDLGYIALAALLFMAGLAIVVEPH